MSKKSVWDKIKDNSVYLGRSAGKLEGAKNHNDLMKTRFKRFGDNWIESKLRLRIQRNIAKELDIRDELGHLAPHLIPLSKEFTHTLAGFTQTSEYKYMTMDELKQICSLPITWEYWRERQISRMIDGLIGQNRPTPQWWLENLRPEIISEDPQLRGMVIRWQVPYQETGVTRVPGTIWRWDTVGNIIKYVHSTPGKTFKGFKDDVRSSDDEKTPTHTDMIVCKECGRLFYVPNLEEKKIIVKDKDTGHWVEKTLMAYPGGRTCPDCDPWVWGIVGRNKATGEFIFIPMRLAEWKQREANFGMPDEKSIKISKSGRGDSMAAALERYKKIMEAGGKRVNIPIPTVDKEEVVIKKRSSKKSKMEEALAKYKERIKKD